MILFGFSTNSRAQFRFSGEVGIATGAVAFLSDYGERGDSETDRENSGFGIGAFYVFNFSDVGYAVYRDNSYFNEHFKLRAEASYNKTELEHFGKWVQNKNSLGVQKLLAMKGSSELINLGTQLEYYPLDIHDFGNTTGAFGPFLSLGAQVSYYNAKATSSMGDLGTPATTFYKYLTPSDGHPFGFSTESKIVLSVTSSVGTRYKLNPLQDLILEVRYQYFNSDWVDGLNPNKDLYKENKYNDAILWLNVGYIYYLEY